MNDPQKIDKLGRMAVLVLIVGFVGLAYHQTIQPLLAARKNLGAFTEAIQILSDAEGSVERLQWEVQVVSRQISQSEALLPKDIDLDAFLEQLGDLATTTQVRVERFQPFPPVPQRLYRELPLEVNLSGSFMSIYNFLFQLELGSRLCRIEKLGIVWNDSQQQCDATVRLTLYYAREEVS
ncbi:MAG: type 4a pilus biogenesis protein PilO [bacterium]